MTARIESYLKIIDDSTAALRVTDGKHRPWLAKSQIRVTRFRGPNHPDALISIPVWLAKKTGLLKKQS